MMSDNFNTPLKRTSPEKQGISSSAIIEFIDALESSEQEIHSFMLLRHGAVVAEGWWSPYAATIPHMMFSLSKSFTSTAVGMAVSEGHFTVDDPVMSFFEDDIPDDLTGQWENMQIRHLLSMSTGHDIGTFPAMYDQKEGNWAKGFFEVPLVYAPGEQFLYNTGATYMLSEIVQRTTGLTLMAYLKPRLYEPLGIEDASWLASPAGVDLGGVGLSVKTEDIARFGQLYLQKGLWQGKRILSEAWIEEATSAQVSNGDDPESDWAQGYGYQFWRCKHGFYRGDGAFGQFCFVLDEFDAVLAMTSGVQDMQAVMNIVWDKLLPVFGEDVLEEDEVAYGKLKEKSSNLSLAPVAGQATSPDAVTLSGNVYIAEPNSLGVESLTFDFSDSACTLRLVTSRGEEMIRATHHSWEEGQSALFNEIWLDGALPLVASGAWVDGHYVMGIRLYKTPYLYNLNCQFEGDTLTVAVHINVSLISTETQIIKAKLA